LNFIRRSSIIGQRIDAFSNQIAANLFISQDPNCLSWALPTTTTLDLTNSIFGLLDIERSLNRLLPNQTI
jgi:hypothetical protein